jgi:hypothetical protein
MALLLLEHYDQDRFFAMLDQYDGGSKCFSRASLASDALPPSVPLLRVERLAVGERLRQWLVQPSDDAGCTWIANGEVQKYHQKIYAEKAHLAPMWSGSNGTRACVQVAAAQ